MPRPIITEAIPCTRPTKIHFYSTYSLNRRGIFERRFTYEIEVRKHGANAVEEADKTKSELGSCIRQKSYTIKIRDSARVRMKVTLVSETLPCEIIIFIFSLNYNMCAIKTISDRYLTCGLRRKRTKTPACVIFTAFGLFFGQFSDWQKR